jgi:hypothetical protein
LVPKLMKCTGSVIKINWIFTSQYDGLIVLPLQENKHFATLQLWQFNNNRRNVKFLRQLQRCIRRFLQPSQDFVLMWIWLDIKYSFTTVLQLSQCVLFFSMNGKIKFYLEMKSLLFPNKKSHKVRQNTKKFFSIFQ